MSVGGNKALISDVVFVISNVGHSVAQNFQVQPLLFARRTDTGKECESSKEDLAEAKRRDIGAVIFPGQTIKGGRATMIDIPSGDPTPLYFRLVGCVRYQTSVDSAPHYTRMVYFVTIKGSGETNFVPNSLPQDVELVLDGNGTKAN